MRSTMLTVRGVISMMIHKEDTSKGDATKEDPNKGENIYKADYE